MDSDNYLNVDSARKKMSKVNSQKRREYSRKVMLVKQWKEKKNVLTTVGLKN